MRINKLDLVKYGHFTDYSIQFERDKPFNIIFGPNESGKTTMLNAVTGLFYGIPKNTAYDFKHGTPVIGAEIEYTDGRLISYQRKKGARTISLYDGEKDKDKKIAEQADGVKNEIQEETFKNMFALDHQILRAGGKALMEVGGELGKSLFIASSGVNNLEAVQKSLESRIDSIYKTRGKIPEINQLIAALNKTNKVIKEKSLKIDEFKHSEQEVKESHQELEACKKELNKLTVESSRMSRLSVLLPHANQYREAVNKRRELGEFEYLPADISQEREEIQKNLNEAVRERESLKKEILQILDSKAQIHVPRKIFSNQDNIKELKEQLGQYREAVRISPQKKIESENYEKQAVSVLLKLKPELKSLEGVEKLRLSLEEVENIKVLAQQWIGLDNKLKDLNEEIAKNEQDIKENEARIQRLPELINSSCIKDKLEEVQKQGDIENLLAEQELKLSRQQNDFAGKYKTIPLWVGEEDDVLRVKLPLETTLSRYEGLYKGIEEKLHEIDIIIEQNTKDMVKNQMELAELQEQGDILNENQLISARDKRQAGWEIVKKVLADKRHDEAEYQYTQGLKLEDVYERDVRQADDIADTLRQEADRAAQQSNLISKIEEYTQKITEMNDIRDAIGQEKSSLDNAWELEWQGIPLERILSPLEMRSWIAVFLDIRTALHEIENTRTRAAELKKSKEQSILMLKEMVKGTELEKQFGLKDLISSCQKRISDIDRLNNEYEKLSEKIQENKDYGKELGRQLQSKEAEIELWQGKWTVLIAKAGMHTDVEPETALKYMNTLHQMFELIDKMQSAQREYLLCMEFIERFEKRTNTLALETDLMDLLPGCEQAVVRMDAIREKAEQDRVMLEDKNVQLEKKQNEQHAIVDSIQEYEEQIRQMLVQAKCKDLEQMKQQEARSRSAREQDEKMQAARNILVTNLPDTTSTVEDLLIEMENVDADQLKSEINNLQEAISMQEKRKETLLAIYLQAENEYSALNRNVSEEAAMAAQEAQELTAKIRNLAEEYLRLKIARKVLAQSIKIFSQKNQNYIIERAGEFFSRLTLKSFSGLKIGQDDSYRQVLFGIRSTGDEIGIEEMSEGTQDQLYLAMRLANIEQYMTNNRPIPVIMDDLLINFDDDRAWAALGILEELSSKLQIIYFTHHQHIKEIAKMRILPEILHVQDM